MRALGLVGIKEIATNVRVVKVSNCLSVGPSLRTALGE